MHTILFGDGITFSVISLPPGSITQYWHVLRGVVPDPVHVSGVYGDLPEELEECVLLQDVAGHENDAENGEEKAAVGNLRLIQFQVTILKKDNPA